MRAFVLSCAALLLESKLELNIDFRINFLLREHEKRVELFCLMLEEKKKKKRE